MIAAAPAAHTGRATASKREQGEPSPFFTRSPRSLSGQTALKSDMMVGEVPARARGPSCRPRTHKACPEAGSRSFGCVESWTLKLNNKKDPTTGGRKARVHLPSPQIIETTGQDNGTRTHGTHRTRETVTHTQQPPTLTAQPPQAHTHTHTQAGVRLRSRARRPQLRTRRSPPSGALGTPQYSHARRSCHRSRRCSRHGTREQPRHHRI